MSTGKHRDSTEKLWNEPEVPSESTLMPRQESFRAIRIKISDRAKRVIAEIAAKHDMKEQGVSSRILNWFGEQPDEIQRTILGLWGDRGADIAKLILEAEARKGSAADRKGPSKKSA